MEVVGVVLAILPLIISAAENYECCFRPIERYCHFSSRLDRFQQRFGIQRTIFRNQCRILLEDIVEHDVAIGMLDDRAHPGWNDESIEKQLLLQLRSSKDACLSILQDIEGILRELETSSKEFSDAVKQEEKSVSIGRKAWRSRITKKLKFSFSGTRLTGALSELKSLNDDFRILSSQTSRLEARRQVHKAQAQSQKLGRDVEKFRTIQKASRKVYEALGRSCTKHVEHVTHFCLDAVSTGDEATSRIQFRVAFANLAVDGEGASFFLIESILNECPQLRANTLSFIDSMQRKVSECPPYARPQDKEKTLKLLKSVKRVIDNPQKCGPNKRTVRFFNDRAIPNSSQPLKNLCIHSNLCDQLRLCLQQSSGAYRCLGKLGQSDSYEFLIYLPPPLPRTPAAKRAATSLEQVISTLSRHGPLGRLSQYERLHLARSLATAALQYHATPWLQNTWRSGDILFFDIDEKSLGHDPPSSLSAPHVDVKVKGPDSTLARVSNFPPEQLAPNPLLFGLGILLLEIAYMATLQSLLQPQEVSRSDNRYAEFFGARRLAGIVGREMGSRYGKITQKCLGCHFAAGCDLNDPELQTEFYKDVVKELENLEDELRGLHLGR